jgi:phosphoglycolate phosphatase
MFKDTTIVFDLDGTLVDTAPDLTHALNYALARAGQAPVSAETVRSLVGMGARVMIEEGLQRAGVTGDLESMFGDFLSITRPILRWRAAPSPARSKRSTG